MMVFVCGVSNNEHLTLDLTSAIAVAASDRGLRYRTTM